MKYKYITSLLTLSLLIFGIGIATRGEAFEKEWTFAQKEVWKMEQIEWEFWKQGNVKRCMLLYHKNYIGWPSQSAELINKNHAGAHMKHSVLHSYDIEPRGINIVGNIAIVYYCYSCCETNGKTHAGRVTHIWMNENGRWRLIGGMTAE
jgi:hypothetical protein